MITKQYNKKQFLLPHSIRSMAAYHAKIMSDGQYMFRIHDCNTGIRLRGDLYNREEAIEAFLKLQNLAEAAMDFAKFIDENYIIK